MKKTLLPITFALAALASLWHCQSKKTPPAAASPTLPTDLTAMVRMTHKEATDTLRADTTQPMVPIKKTKLSAAEAQAALASIDLKQAMLAEWPDNGFYGADRYRIEFIFTSIERRVNDPSVYAVTGKNKYKKTISDYAGVMEIKEVYAFSDPNLRADEIADLGYEKMYALVGEFRFHEDSTLKTSGLFSGKFQVDVGKMKDGGTQLWFFSPDSPAEGSGYRFDGNWTSYRNAQLNKPVIWSRDLFRFANDILQEFSYGERDIEINPKYRHLGWDTFWEGDEWWN
jgi:hypothetical protein